MEVFSLEEHDCPELFITQESSKENSDVNNSEKDTFLGVDVMDFKHVFQWLDALRKFTSQNFPTFPIMISRK